MVSFLLSFDGCQFAYFAENLARPVESGYLVSSSYLSVSHAFQNAEFYRHGWHSWSPTAWRKLSEPVFPVEPPSRRLQCDDRSFANAKTLGGSALGALREDALKPALFVGSLDLCCRIDATQNTLSARFTNGKVGEFFVCYDKFENAARVYAKLLESKYGSRANTARKNVWCSWYSFGQQISEDILKSQLAQAKDFGIDVFQIDDGWQKDIGDWENNDRFDSGMKAFAVEVQKAGFEPGIWLAPLLVRPTSELFKSHPEWILKDSRGNLLQAGFNWGAPTYALDARLPAVKDWLVSLFQKVVSWGYTYLKLDFMYAGALLDLDGLNFNAEDLYRTTLQLIRNTVGNDVYLLLCGSPVMASLGIADGLRIGPDVAPYWDNEERSVLMHDRSWPSTRNAIRTCVHRLWLRDLVHCDADVVYFRSRYNLLKPNQRKVLEGLAEVTGFKGTSDPFEWLLDDEKLEMKRFFLTHKKIEQVSEFRFQVGDDTFDCSEHF